MDDKKQPKTDRALSFGLFTINFVAMLIICGGVILLAFASFSMIFSLLGQFSWQAFRLGLYALGAGIGVYSIGRAMCYFATLIKETNQQHYHEHLLLIYGLSLASEVIFVALVVAGYGIMFMLIGMWIDWDKDLLYGSLIWGSIFTVMLSLRKLIHRYGKRYQQDFGNIMVEDSAPE